MRWAVAGLGTLLAGMLTFMGIYFVLDGTIVNEENYHGLKEAMAGAMYDSVDIDYYQQTGEIKIIREKFVETFTRRFVESTKFGKKNYTLEFYDIIESPPKASVIIKGIGGEVVLSLDSDELSSYDIINKLDGILVYNAKHLYTYELYAIGNVSGENIPGIKSYQIKIPDELKRIYNLSEETVYTGSGSTSNTSATREKCKVVNIEYVDSISKSAYNGNVKNDFHTNRNNWYYNTASYINTNVNSNFCEIEAVTLFKYNPETSYTDNRQEKGLDDIKVILKGTNCNITGYKMRVTWQCHQ